MPQDKPNILLIMADQLTPLMTSPYGFTIARTPNMERLARSGVLFENAYTTCPICAPARMSLLTGKHVSTIDCNDNGSVLRADEPTHNHYLSLAGYDTVLSGKLHAIGPDQLHGFARRLTTDVFPADFNFLMRRKLEGSFMSCHEHPISTDYVTEGVGVRQWSMQLDYDEETLFRAREYLRSKRTRPSGTRQKPLPPRDDRPFFLQVSFCHPHEPFHCTQHYWDLYEGVDIPIPEKRENIEQTYTQLDRSLNMRHGCGEVDLMNPESLRAMHRAYLASVSYIDDKIGQLLTTLEECGLMDDTVVIFTSDHGDMLGHRGMIQKRTFYEQSSRVYLSVTFPANHMTGTAGARCADPASLADVCPTMLDIAGVSQHLPMDGTSLMPQLRGEHDPDRFVFCENHSEGAETACFMVRRGKHKYVYLHGVESQLFDLEADPGEWNDLAGRPEFAELENELRSLILDRFDPERIDRELDASIARRWLIKEAHGATGRPPWAYQPFFDAQHQYWREG